MDSLKIITIVFLTFSTLVNAQFTINDTFANFDECDYMTREGYIIWWDKDFDYTTQADITLDKILGYRDVCLEDLNMMSPPSVLDGFYQNIYLHGDGGFFDTNGWGNGVGTDSNGYPFYTMPIAVFNDDLTLAHEIFHLYQYNANSPGYAYAGDSQWYIEASANWFATTQHPTAQRAFIEGESLVRLPQVPLWLSFDNFPDEYPDNWQRFVHQYALNSYLIYLTEEAGVLPAILSEGFYLNINVTPQEYLFNQLGAQVFRDHFIDWAGRMTNDFDFITEEQRLANEQEWDWYADPADDNEFTETYSEEGSGDWYQPNDNDVTNAWSFNTYKVENENGNAFTFEIDGDAQGTFGTPAYFQGQVVVKSTDGTTLFYNLDMDTAITGSLTIDVTNTDTEIFFIIAAMPVYFEEISNDFQKFPYQMRITNNTLSVKDIATESGIVTYPNPAENLLYITNATGISIDSVAIYDINGRVVLSQNQNHIDQEIQIDISHVTSGVYIVQFVGEFGVINKRLIKQ